MTQNKLTDKQIKYRKWYQENRESERRRKAKEGSALPLIIDILNIWEKQGISEKYWSVYEKSCAFIGRIPRTVFKISVAS